MRDTSAFGTQVIGQTEKALNALLAGLLAGTGLSEPQLDGLNFATVATVNPDGSPQSSTV